MTLPNPQLVNGEPVAMLREALEKMLQYMDTQAILMWNVYTEQILARRDRQMMMGVPMQPPEDTADEDTVRKLQERKTAPLQPNRAARRAAQKGQGG